MVEILKRRLSDVPIQDKNGKLKMESSTPKPQLTREQQQEKIFNNLRLKRIVKENHGYDITQLAFFFNNKNFDRPVGLDIHKTYDKRGSVQRPQDDTSNVLGSVGGAQINIYDNEHYGDHLDIMSNFNLASDQPEDEDTSQRNLNTFCWLYQKDDAIIVTGGGDADIHVISVAQSKVIALLQGHTKRILDIQSHPQNDNNILSVSKDGTVRYWDLETRRCLFVFDYECNVACFHPSGNSFITGTAKGEFREWTIPAYMVPMDEDDNDTMTIGKSNSRLLKKMHGDSTIDCMRYVKGYLLSKSINGRMEYWDPAEETSIRSFRVKTGENHCRFDVTLDDTYFCVGTSHGSAFVYNLESGKLMVELSHRRSTKAVRCVAFSRDSHQILCGGEDGFIWRYDYIDDDTLALWAAWRR